MVGSTYKRSPAQLKQLQDLAAAVIGMDPQRGDVVTVENMTFSNTGDSDAAPTFGERLQKTLNDNVSALKYASLLLLFVLAWALDLPSGAEADCQCSARAGSREPEFNRGGGACKCAELPGR